MKCSDALEREGTAAMDPQAVTFSFTPSPTESRTVYWDVTAITRHLISTKAKPDWMQLAGLEKWFEEGRIEIDREHAMSARVDPRIPILAIAFEEGSVPIDGWHRIYRALQFGWPALPVLFLEAEEECRFRYPQELCDRLEEIARDPGYRLLEERLTRAMRQGREVFVIAGP